MSLNLLVGVTGSIGSLSAPGYIYYLKEKFPNLQIIVSHSAQKFISKDAMSLISKTHDDLFTSSLSGASHIQLANWADLFIIFPATAHVLAQTAHGFADTFISATILSHRHPVIFFPNMNDLMWNNPATMSNVARIKEFGHLIIDPVEREGYDHSTGEKTTDGFLPSPDQVLSILLNIAHERAQKDEMIDATKG